MLMPVPGRGPQEVRAHPGECADPVRPESPRARGFRRHLALQRLGYKDYSAYIGSSAWADVKRRYRASDLPQDCFCGETENLHLHHLTYERVGQEELTDLSPLCGDCHRMIHVLEKRGDLKLDLVGLVNKKRAERERQHGELARITERRAAEDPWTSIFHNSDPNQVLENYSGDSWLVQRRNP